MINLEKLLNIKIDKIYCISLEERKDRREFLKTQFEKLDHEVHYHIVKRNPDPIKGCLESHIECIKEAKELGYTNILMLEDDILINESVMEEMKPIHIPEDFDMFYLGYHVNNGLKYGNNILKLLSAQTTHSYIMNSRVFDYVIENIHKDWTSLKEWKIRNKYESLTNYDVKAIDLFYSKFIHHQRLKSYGIYPILIDQKPDYSDIEKRNIDYRSLMKGKSVEFYKKEPYNFDIWLLNLERRKDRWEKMEKVVHEYNLNAYKIKAIDGLIFNFEKYKDLFSLRDFQLRTKNPYQPHQYQKGVLGCALSHYKMWETISTSKNLNNEDYVLIIEDDCYFIDNFLTRLNVLLDELKYKMWDICFLGYTDYVGLEDDKEEGNNLIKLSGSRRLHGGGTFAYLITKAGAKKYYDIANDRNIQQAVDWFMIEQYDKVNAYKTKTDLVYSNVAGVGGHDSDVQNLRKPYYDIEVKFHTFKGNKFFKDQYDNVFTIDDPFKMNYIGKIVDEKKIEIQRFTPAMSKTKFTFSRNKATGEISDKFYAIYAGGKMKMFIHFFAKYLMENMNVKIFVFYNDFDMKFDDVQYINKNKFDKLNSTLKFNSVIIFDLIFFITHHIKDYNEIVLLEDGELFFEPKYKKITLPNFGTYLVHNILEKVDKIITLSKTEAHYFKARTGIVDELPVFSPVMKSNDLIEDDIEVEEDDILFITYDNDVKSIINFFNTLDIEKKKLLVFSDVFQASDDKIIIKNRMYKFNHSYLDKAMFYISQSKMADDFYLTNLAIQKGLVCIIPEYYQEFSNKTITFKNTIKEVKEKIESCIKTPKRLDIYKRICKTYGMTLEREMLDFNLFDNSS